ncbi:hypothetical protein DRH14_03095 [Candidatus Shapirobacteria bacterium]|nr:MAG: hypothetical protein DRH14_03095 [Candidatus Shapirobacteria bacterium]
MIKKFLKNWDKFLLFLMLAIYVVVMSFLSIRKYQSFADSYDLANADQTVWTSGHDYPFSLTGVKGRVSRLQFHADFILALLAPFYWLWNDVRMLLILQSLSLALAGVVLFYLARDILKNKLVALILSASYWLNPGLLWTNIYDVHGVSFAPFLLLLLFWLVYKMKWKLVWPIFILSIFCKENVALFTAMLGLGMLFSPKRRKIGVIMFLVSSVYFYVASFVWIPHFSDNGQHWVMGWYSDAKRKLFEIKSATSLWFFVKGYFFNFDSFKYYRKLLEPFAFLPLLSVWPLFLVAPELAIISLSSQGQMKSIVMHYDSLMVVGMVIANIWTVKYISWLFKKIKIVPILVSLLILVASLRSNYFYSPLPTTPGHWRLMYRLRQVEKDFDKVLKQIPTEDIITASSEVRNHLTHRVNAFNLPHGIEEADWIAMTEKNHLVGDYEKKPFETDLIKKLDADDNYQLVFHQGDYFLYKRK